MSTLRIHIGPFKTATTTIQRMLESGRQDMLAAGFLYPTTAPRNGGHLEAVIDFVDSSAHVSPWRGKFEVEYAKYEPRRRRGSWLKLRNEIRGHDGPAVVSHEILCRLPPAIASDFVKQLAADKVEVVMVRRRPSELVPSLYLERIKVQREPTFAEFVGKLFIELPINGASENEFLHTPRLVSNWRQAGAEVVVIDAVQGLSDDVVVEVGRALTPGLDWTAPSEPFNVSMSAHGAQLWLAHSTAHPPAFAGSGHAVRNRMLKAFPQTASGSHLRLSPEAAAALDAYCDGTIDHLPIPAILTEPVPLFPFDSAKALRMMARWQRLEDLRWKSIDAASALTGRGHLMTGLFEGGELAAAHGAGNPAN